MTDIESEYGLLLARNNVLSERISELQAKLARVEKLPEKWRKYPALKSPGADTIRGWRCADDLMDALEQDDE